jgi:hypothetical protein
MYLPSHFAESRSEVMHALMQAHPFATLVTQGGMGLSADHLPLHLAAAIGPFGAAAGPRRARQSAVARCGGQRSAGDLPRPTGLCHPIVV